MSEAPPSDELTPLFLVVADIFRSVPCARKLSGGPGRDDSHLDALAGVIATLVPLIVYSQDGRFVRALTAKELDEGIFRHGGRRFCFLDGRPEVTNLAMRTNDIAPLIASMEQKLVV